MMKHLRNNRGESLAEVLVAVLIIAAGLLALAGMVRVATKSVSNSRTTVNKFYKSENAIESNETNKKSTGKVTIQNYPSFDVDMYSDNGLYRYEVQNETNNANQNNK